MSTTDDDLSGGFILPVDDDDPIIDPRDVQQPDDKPPAKTPEELRAENERLAAQVGDLTAQRDFAKLAVERTQPAAPVTAPPQPDNSDSRRMYETYMADIAQKRLMGDNEGADKALMSLVDGLVDSKVKQAQAPITAGSARQIVRNFESGVKDAPEFPRVREAFVSHIEAAMPGLQQMTPEQQQLAVETLYDVVVGKEARKSARNGRTETPPPYNAGTGGSPVRPASRQKALTAVQRQYIKSAREYGMPEETIAKRLTEMEQGIDA